LRSSYQSAVARLYQLGHELTSARKFDLAHMRVLLGALGDPQRRWPGVLIAGTNGKGSTAATLASIVRAAGHRIGLYTSPHVLRVNERVRINGEEISGEAFARLFDRVERTALGLVAEGALPWHPSFFEMLTAMAFLHFAEPAVEIAILEVGMGGRLDATNVIDPLVSVLTDISLDHQKFLGNTLAEIAAEKAGIIRPGGAVVLLPQHPAVNDVLGNAILERGARALSAVAYVPPPTRPPANDYPGLSEGPAVTQRYPLEVRNTIIQVDSPLLGSHQQRNLALAIAAAEELHRQGVTISPHDIETGIRETRWPGRFQVLPAYPPRPELVLDVAHNPAGAWALRAALSERYSGRPLTFVFGVMRDKAVAEIAQILFPLAQHVVAARADNPRAASPEEIRAAVARICPHIVGENSVAAAVQRACALTPAGGVVVVTGSIYLVAEALAALRSAPENR
jgi:dihydrofolate synthase/folylpolyglutamate synthase